MMTKLELYSQTSGYWNKYNSSIDATIANNFASSSFRFAHTLIPVSWYATKSYFDANAMKLTGMMFSAFNETGSKRYFESGICRNAQDAIQSFWII